MWLPIRSESNYKGVVSPPHHDFLDWENCSLSIRTDSPSALWCARESILQETPGMASRSSSYPAAQHAWLQCGPALTGQRSTSQGWSLHYSLSLKNLQRFGELAANSNTCLPFFLSPTQSSSLSTTECLSLSLSLTHRACFCVSLSLMQNDASVFLSSAPASTFSPFPLASPESSCSRKSRIPAGP